MEVCSLSMEAKKSTRGFGFAIVGVCVAAGVAVDDRALPVSALNGFVGSGRATIRKTTKKELPG